MPSETSSTSPSVQAPVVNVVGVVGAGQMGGGIAQVAAAAGLRVVLIDAGLELAQRGKARIERALASWSRRAR